MDSSRNPYVVNQTQSNLLLDTVNRHMVLDAVQSTKSVKEFADSTQLNFGNVHYRVRKLLAAGLLDIQSIEKRPGRPIKRYRSVSRSFLLQGVLVQDPLRRILTMICEQIDVEDSTLSGIWIGVDESGQRLMKRIESGDTERTSYQVCRQLYLENSERSAFRSELETLLAKYASYEDRSGTVKPFTIWAGVAKGRLRDS